MKNVIQSGLTAAAILGLAMFAFNTWISVPDVEFSYSSGGCVKVINYDDSAYNCENLPAKFNHIWVK